MSKEHLSKIRKKLRDQEVEEGRRKIRVAMVQERSRPTGEVPMEIESDTGSYSRYLEQIKFEQEFLTHYQLSLKPNKHSEEQNHSPQNVHSLITSLYRTALEKQKLDVSVSDLKSILWQLYLALQSQDKTILKGQCMSILSQYFYDSFLKHLHLLEVRYKKSGKEEIKQLKEVKHLYISMNNILTMLEEKIEKNEVTYTELHFFLSMLTSKTEIFNCYQLFQNKQILQNMRKSFALALLTIERAQLNHQLLNLSLFICQHITRHNIVVEYNNEPLQIWKYLDKAFSFWNHHRIKHQIREDSLEMIFKSAYNAIQSEAELDEHQYFFVHRVISQGITLSIRQELSCKRDAITELTLKLMLQCFHFDKLDSRWLDYCLQVVEQSFLQQKFDNKIKLALLMLYENDKYGLPKMVELKNYLNFQEMNIFNLIISDFEKMGHDEEVVQKLVDSLEL